MSKREGFLYCQIIFLVCLWVAALSGGIDTPLLVVAVAYTVVWLCGGWVWSQRQRNTFP